MGVDDVHQVQLVSYKLKGGAGAWWDQLQNHRRRSGRQPICSWPHMRQLLRARFLPPDYEQIFYQQYQQCRQQNRSVADYASEFYRLNARTDLIETEHQQVARFLGGLRDQIQATLSLHSIWSLADAVNLTTKVESQLSHSWGRSFVPRKAPTNPTPLPGSDPLPSQPSTSNAVAPPHSPVVKPSYPRPPNPYPRPTTDRCYHCFKPGHRSNDCPKRRTTFLCTDEPEAFGDLNASVSTDGDEYFDADFLPGDEGDPVVCILEKLLLAPHQPSPSQRNSLFRTRCTVNTKVCDVVIDSGSTENVVSKALVKTLGLPTSPHPRPYKIGWIKRGIESKVTELCRFSFSIGKSYQDEISCDIVEMDACHILLGHPWLFDRDVTHKGRDNTYFFNGKAARLCCFLTFPLRHFQSLLQLLMPYSRLMFLTFVSLLSNALVWLL
ncbi:uncharacterized protein LOC133804215 [Humulus lupulus]|uniref:uncharacterized protein LOC133804215 n=1 Tax=Humulus lupulus TaxID=3486 RepID=UPI002B402929|nr:uncharacterized protein LOC133804215 [Humulus lupulus]